MTSDEKKEVLQGLTEQRDNLQQTMNEAHHTKAKLMLQNREKQAEFLQKLGELSFTFGAAIVPIIIISHSSNKVTHLPYVLVGVAIYILNGLVALWQLKAKLEKDADDTPFVGLDEQIMAYPVINSLNKLLLDVDNEDYQKEYWQAANNATKSDATDSTASTKPKANFLLDLVILDFVIASLFVIRAVWSYGTAWYWVAFSLTILFIIALTTLSYIRTIKNQFKLQTKKATLQKIRAGYQDWFNKKVGKGR